MKALTITCTLGLLSSYVTAAGATPPGSGAPRVLVAAPVLADTVTGCLQKGTEAGEFTLMGSNGKTYEVMSKHVKLASHVGHMVTLTGKSAVEHAKMEDDKSKPAPAMDTTKMGGKEGGAGMGMEAGTMDVTDLKMVSATCK